MGQEEEGKRNNQERDDEARGQAETTLIKAGHPPEYEGHVHSGRGKGMAKSCLRLGVERKAEGIEDTIVQP